MSQYFSRILCLSMLTSTVCPAEGKVAGEALQLTLPRELYAVPGSEMSIYFDNVVLTKTPEEYQFDVQCDIGEVASGRWTVMPDPHDVGEHRLSMSVSASDGTSVASASALLRVIPADAGAGREVRLLIVGDSLTHATLYVNEIARLLSQPSNPRWQMFGTHRPKSAIEGVAHEGYGGWTWQLFASKYEHNPDGTHRKRSSPFVYLSADKIPQLDVARYVREECGGQPPDFVVFMLGINDCFSAAPAEPNASIDAMFKQADVLLEACRQAAPKAEFGICLVTPPNAREAAFEANYKGRYTRWNWKRIQHRLVQRQLERFADTSRNATFVIPTQLNLDPVDGYPHNNGVHPNAAGYRQIGTSIYAWLKSRFLRSTR